MRIEEIDKPIPEDEAISACHPARNKNHASYAEAMRLVGAKHSKYALVDLVNWLLQERDEARDLLSTSEALKDFHETNENELRRVLTLAMRCLEFLVDDGGATLHEPEFDDLGDFVKECPEDDSCTCISAKMFNDTHRELLKVIDP